MKNIFIPFFGFLLFLASSNLCHAQYSISGHLDTPEKNKRVYLSLLRYNEERTISKEQLVTSTVTDSTGYFSFEGQLLSDKHSIYRIHSRVDEKQSLMQMTDHEEGKNFHNFVFSNQDTIVFEKNDKFWFSNNSNTNLVDQEWQQFSSYVNQLQRELSTLTNFNRDKSSSQALSELKTYTDTKKIHPLVTLTLLAGIQPSIVKADLKNDILFYQKLEESLDDYYENSSYALQFKELLTDLSKTETLQDLEFYKRSTYILSSLCALLLIGLIVLFIKFKRTKTAVPQENLNLTNQEERVAELIIQEKSNKEIATELFISLSTVKTHIRNLYAKLEVNNRQEFVEKFKNHPRD